MHAPLPYGRFAEQADLSNEDAAFVANAVQRVTNFKTVSGLESLKRVFTLPSGRECAVISMGGILKAVVYAPHESPEYVFDGVANEQIPMLFSGVITKAQVAENEGVGVRLTEQCRRRIAGYTKEWLPEKDVQLRRFSIKYSLAFDYFEPDHPGIFTFTQYTKLRPTWYSGAMVQVMQVVGGYGKQKLGELPEDPVERASITVPERYMQKIRLQLRNSRLPGYTGAPDQEGRFLYEYRSSGNNGVAFDSGGAPWLLQINARGVFAMPLPMVPATTTAGFREYVEDVKDSELLALLDRFGGLPSGESFPLLAKDFEAWRRAGVIIKVCDTADFYTFSSIYPACGWAFNSNGSEAFNTCQEMREDNLTVVHGYKIGLKLGVAKNRGLAEMSWEFSDDSEKDAVNHYLAALFQALDHSQKSLAIKYKIRQQPLENITARAGGDGAGDVDYWDNLEADPIATHTGYCTRVSSGPVYWPAPVPTAQGRLKFPELRGQGMESFPLANPSYRGPAVRCDTVMFGCYVEDELQVIKYFYDERKFFMETKSTFEPVMIVGSWENTVTIGETGLMGNLYTSTDDRRAEASPSVTNTLLVGTDMGYGQPAFVTPVAMMRVGGLYRTRYYMHRQTTTIIQGEAYDMAAFVPVFARDFIGYAYRYMNAGKTVTEETSQHGMDDPNSYELWTHDDIFHYLFTTTNGNLGMPYPVDGNLVYVDTLVYTPSEYSDFADGGNWFGLPPGGFIDVTYVCGRYTSRSSDIQAGGVKIGGEKPGFDPFFQLTVSPPDESGDLSISADVSGHAKVLNDIPHGWYFAFSPENDSYFYRDMTRTAIGSSRYMSFDEPGEWGPRKHWGYTGLADHKSAHHFIGVINE